MLNYISTRDGVDTDSCYKVDEEKLKNASYVKYIAKRKGVDTGGKNHGLFGKIKDMKYMGDIYDLDSAIKYVRSKAIDKTTIYNAVISFDEQTAIDKDFTNKDEFARMVKNNISSIAYKMGIPAQNIEYCASVHNEKSHPHVHLMYWNKDQKIVVNFIKPELSNKVRIGLIKNVFGEEIKQIQLEKDETKKQFNEAVGTLLHESKNTLNSSSPEEVKAIIKSFSHHLLDKKGISKQSEELFDKIVNLTEYIDKHYPVGGLKYKYLPSNVKNHLDNLVDEILSISNPQLTKEYIKYLNITKDQAEIFGGDDNVKTYIAGADSSLRKYIANQVLSVCKDIKQNMKLSKSDNIFKRNMMYRFFQNILNAVIDNQNHVSNYSSSDYSQRKNYHEMSQIDRDNLRHELDMEYER